MCRNHSSTLGTVSILYEVKRLCNRVSSGRSQPLHPFQSSTRLSAFATRSRSPGSRARIRFQSSTRLSAFATNASTVPIAMDQVSILYEVKRLCNPCRARQGRRVPVSILYEVKRLCNEHAAGQSLSSVYVSILYEVKRLCNRQPRADALHQPQVSILYEVKRLCNLLAQPVQALLQLVSILYEVKRLCNGWPTDGDRTFFIMFQSSTRLSAFATHRGGALRAARDRFNPLRG